MSVSQNRQRAYTLLIREGIDFEMGLGRWVIRNGRFVVDFWPRTGRWRIRGESTDRYGLTHLLRTIGVTHEA